MAGCPDWVGPVRRMATGWYTMRPDEQICCDPYCKSEERYVGEAVDLQKRAERAEGALRAVAAFQCEDKAKADASGRRGWILCGYCASCVAREALEAGDE